MDFMPESTAKTSRDRAPHIITTGKRMDHQTPPCSSFGLVETSSSCYSGGGGCMSSEEEEDMANCLIMLAYSDKPDHDHYQKTDKLKLRSVTEMTTTLGGNSSFHNYECKTCNRAFPSFQALGGHRASHKKPKITIEDRNFGSIKTEFSREDQPEFQLHYEENKIVATSNNKKGKIHECSICGSEFLSGQALGGHMRRHRAPLPSTNPMNYTSTEKSHLLSIDLNLPAPEVVEDVHSSNHHFTATSSSPRPLVISTVALVDCHY